MEQAATSGRRERLRKFAREVGGVVLGVLIALGIGELAEAWRWKVRVDRSIEAMRMEAGGNRFNIAERAAAQVCIDRRLGEIASLLDAAGRGQPLPKVGPIGSPPDRVVERAAFDMATGQGVWLHTDADGARDAALIYQLSTLDFPARAADERAAWQGLTLVEQAWGTPDPDTLLALRQSLAAARSAGAAMVPVLQRADRLLAGKRIPVEYGRLGNAAGMRRALLATPLCRPLRVES